nr:T4-like baseplate tail tube cap [uncultured Mediterranean phage uvMED]|tara:strand:+ start:16717 stop:18192 length:1476 start_codon:yes stop_codon:yes gene_type:complete
MARTKDQQAKADKQLAKAGWKKKEDGSGKYILGPKPFNGEVNEQVIYEVNPKTGDVEVFKQDGLQETFLANINGKTGSITTDSEKFETFYNNDKAAHKQLLDEARQSATTNGKWFLDEDIANILADTDKSFYKQGLAQDLFNLELKTSLNGTNPFDIDLGLPEQADGTNNLYGTSDETIADTNQGLSLGRRASKKYARQLAYPEDMEGDRIKIEVKEYAKSGLRSASQTFGFGSASTRESKTVSTIFLPIQRGYGDTLSCDWGQGELNPLTAMMAQASYGAISKAAETGRLDSAAGAFVGGIKEAGNTLLGDANGQNEDIRQFIASYFTQQAIGGGSGILSRTAGASINNNLELLFQGPMLRAFSFQFRLTPRSANENKIIKKIIKTFKVSMVPEATESNLFLLAPHVFDIAYLTTLDGGLTQQPYMNKFKRCALKDFSVNYSPDGSYMTYKDGGMTAYDLSMTFAELDPVLSNDYEGVEGDSNNEEGMGF